MERQPHNNLWAEKLLQVSKPDSGDAWVKMEAILDRKMPRSLLGDRRRWILLILLLLLLVGVCNCPGRGRLFHGASTPSAPGAATPAVGSAAPSPGPAAPATPAPSTSRRIPPGPVPLAAVPSPGLDRHTPAAHPDTSTIHPNIPVTRPNTPTTRPNTPATHTGTRDARPSRGTTKVTRDPGTGGHHHTSSDHHPGDHTATHPDAFADTTETAGTPRGGRPSDTTATTTKQGQKPAVPPAAKPVVRKDSSQKKKTPPQDDDEKEKDHGWVIGVGLNQFFPLGDQRGSTYNSDGLTGTLSDYLPVPMIRFYLDTRLYVQLEAQLNTPQPTKKDLVFNSPLPDTATIISNSRVETSATIQQLYYFNIPLSVHYAPTDDLNIGTGLQYSHLSNAVGNFDSTITSLTTNAVVDANATKSFKNDSLFHRIKTNELRFLIDANYTYKHFVLGLRYNQALSKFINLQLPTGGTTQARNSSLQLYLRYILLDTRKKKSLPPK
jgi:hypothetical protein